MPRESKKTIEELLQASAKARRAEFGADPKMPNPMRTRLHDEIAHATREEEPKPRRSWNWFAISWPIGTVAAAVLVVAFVMSRSHEFQPQKQSHELAAKHPARDEALPSSAPQAAATKLDEEKSKALGKFADVANASKQEMPAAAAKPESPVSSSTFFTQNQKAQTNLNQQFSQSLHAGARASKMKQPINVLTTFQIQQTGDQIRVVDADGSTYTGKIEPATQDSMRRAFREKEADFALRSERSQQEQQDNSNQFAFRASGYNSTLKKPIVFEGNYVATPSQSKAPNESGAANQQQSSAHIVGTAKVNGESPIEVDAVAVPQ